MDDRSRYIVGSVLICLVAVIWTLATVLKQVIFQDLEYNEPLVFAYVCNSCYTVQLFTSFAGQCQAKKDLKVNAQTKRSDSTHALREAAILGVAIAPIFFIAQWTYSVGVSMTSVTASTMISSTSAVWALIGSVMFLGERITPLKLVGIIACTAGNAVTLLDTKASSSDQHTLAGDMFCLGSSMLYAAYTVILRRCTSQNTSVAMIFGVLGCTILFVAGGVVVPLRFNELQRMPTTVLALLLVNGFVDNVAAQYAWAWGVLWTSPTAATVGLSMTVPLGIISDLCRCKPVDAHMYIAALLVVTGFLAVSCATQPSAANAEEELSRHVP